MSTDDNITPFPVKPKPTAKGVVTVVHDSSRCRHPRFEVDNKLAEVTCGACKEKLNPIWVLIQLAQEDDRLRDQWAEMRAEIRLLGERTRAKCEHCRKMTRVRIRAGYTEVRALVDKIKAEESP